MSEPALFTRMSTSGAVAASALRKPWIPSTVERSRLMESPFSPAVRRRRAWRPRPPDTVVLNYDSRRSRLGERHSCSGADASAGAGYQRGLPVEFVHILIESIAKPHAPAYSCCVALQAAEDPEFFEMKIRPVLAKQCFGCHAASKMGGLDLTTRAGLEKGGNRGPAMGDGGWFLRAISYRTTSSRCRRRENSRMRRFQI